LKHTVDPGFLFFRYLKFLLLIALCEISFIKREHIHLGRITHGSWT
jgi:hypothetical protein